MKIKDLLKRIFSRKTIATDEGNFKRFFNMAEIKASKAVFRNNAVSAIMKIEPISYYGAIGKKQEQVKRKYREFLRNLNRPIDILIRSENYNIDEKLEIIESRVNHLIEKRKNADLLRGFEAFFKDFKKQINKKARPTNNCYIGVCYKSNSRIESKFKWISAVLDSRISLLNRDLSKIGVKSDMLTNNEYADFYSSYLQDNFFVDGKYITPLHWTKEYLASE